MNKEIEELLNKFKNADSQQFNELVEDFDNVYKLLLYIEQLEKRNKQLYEGFMATQEELTDYATENEQLEEELKYSIGIVQHNQIVTKLSKEKKQLKNNRDKAIEILESMPINASGGEILEVERKTLHILKGDKVE